MHSLIIFSARYLIFLLPIIPVFVWLQLNRTDKKRFIITAVVGGLVTLVLAHIATHLVASPRPFMVDHVAAFFSSARDNGFPSDHTLLASLAAFLTLAYSRRLGYLTLALAGLIGWCRVLANVHHGIDVFGALVIGAISISLVVLVQNRLTKPTPVTK
ncbi:MAG: phosphatase PAP2 family protein [Patescibacteria group bacterium]|nr:phosphatase PAP2 family protein [Patescibacteria group bacterium]